MGDSGVPDQCRTPVVMLAPLMGPRRDEANAKLDPRLFGLEPSVEEKVTGSGSSQVTTVNMFFPACKIGTLEELMVVLNFMVYYAKLHFTAFARTGLVHWEFDAGTKVQIVEVDTTVATSLGLLNVFGTLSGLMQARMPKNPDLVDEGLTMMLQYPWVKITRHEDVKSGLTIELPFNRHHVV